MIQSLLVNHIPKQKYEPYMRCPNCFKPITTSFTVVKIECLGKGKRPLYHTERVCDYCDYKETETVEAMSEDAGCAICGGCKHS